MSTVVTVPVTVTASQSVVVVTSTIAASELPYITGGSSYGAASSTPTASSTYNGSSDSSSSTSPTGSASSSSQSRASSVPIGGIVGGAVGGVALIAFLVALACLARKRSNAKKKAANPFPDDESEKGPAVIAGLPPKPSTQARPVSQQFSITDANSSMALLGTPSQSHGFAGSDARSAFTHRPSTTSLGLGSSASFPHSHGSLHSQPMLPGAAFAGGYPDVNRTAFYEPYAPVGSAAAAYNHANAGPGASVSPRSSAYLADAPILPTGAAPSDYVAASEAARLRGMQQVSEPSGSSPPNDASSRRGSHGAEVDSLHQRRLSAGGLSGYQPHLQPIPGSVAASEVASDHHSMHSSALSNRGAPQLPAVAGASPLMGLNGADGGAFSKTDGYNTYTGAAQGQLRVVGPSGAYGQPTIAEEEPRFSTSSIHKSGSRMLEMLDTEHQAPISVTGEDEPSAPPSRPPFWKERSRSAQSITKVFRKSPRSQTPEIPPSPSAQSSSGLPVADGDTGMWKTSALRKWTTKRTSKGEKEVEVDQLFR